MTTDKRTVTCDQACDYVANYDDRLPRITVVLLVLWIFGACTAPGQTLEESLRSVVDCYAKDGGFAGSALVAVNGRIVMEDSWGLANRTWDVPNSAQTRYRIGSMTKAFTASVVMRLVQEGRLRLDDSLGDFIDGLPPGTARAVTIRHLLTHTSGLQVFYRIPDFDRVWLYESPSLEDLVRTVARHPLEFEPGSRYAYRNIGYIALGVVVESVSGRPFEDELRRTVIRPAGLNDTDLEDGGEIVPNLAQGYAGSDGAWRKGSVIDPDLLFTAGGIHATARDVLGFILALTEGRILTEDMLKQMWKPRVPESDDPDDGRAYGFGWHLDRLRLPGVATRLDIIEHGGDVTSFESLLTIVPAIDAVIVLLHNHGEMDQDDIRNELITILARHETGKDDP